MLLRPHEIARHDRMILNGSIWRALDLLGDLALLMVSQHGSPTAPSNLSNR